MKQKNVNMLSGPITKGLLSMSIPIMVMNVMQTLFAIIDMLVLKKFCDDNAVGSVGACGMLSTLCTSLLIGLSVGANVIVARRIGEGDRERADRAVITSILLSLAGGIIMMLVGVYFSETFLKLTKCSEILLPQATKYFKIYFYGVPILMLYTFFAAILRAIGEVKKPMYFLIVGGIVKVSFTVLLVAGFRMDVGGVALATIISNTVAGGLSFIVLSRSKDVVTLRLRKNAFDIKELKDVLIVGVPAGLQSAMYSFANVVITTVVNTFGAAATTGIAIANQFDGILYQISNAPSLAATPYVAQNIGAGNIKRVRKTLTRAVLITTAFGATFGFLSAFFSEQLSATMSTTPEVIAFSRQKMIIISSTYFICGINEVMGGVLRGMGKSVTPTVTALVFTCLLRLVWVYAIFPLCPNLTFLYTVWPVGWILSIITLLIVYYITILRLQKKHEPELVNMM